ncbi:TRAP transporter small permease [Agarilytica rhodophyticola]|uniref:TRAP transporter small permease n=1 Tax=Agarilytica rhodophyticola TaxID=1737490 RepID=UPI000B3480EB|nr:TRAP transporter small permease [Agarilytica rhodophyticola]
MKRASLYLWNNFEKLMCSFLLCSFVILLFVQIVSRELFSYSFAWIEELSVYMFVWFVYLGASEAARLYAHNRVTIQFKLLPKKWGKYLDSFADLFWIFFNVYFIYLSYDFVFNRMNKFWKSQTLGIEMKYIYIILPVAFTLMTIRIIEVNYRRIIKNEDIQTLDS